MRSLLPMLRHVRRVASGLASMFWRPWRKFQIRSVWWSLMVVQTTSIGCDWVLESISMERNCLEVQSREKNSIISSKPLRHESTKLTISEMLINQELSRMGGRGYGDGLNSGMVIGLPPILNFAKEPLRSKVLEEVFSGQKVAILLGTTG